MTFLLVLLLLVASSCTNDIETETPTTTLTGPKTITFSDENLEAAIRKAIGKPLGDLYKSDLEQLTTLNAQTRGIVNITGLEYCTNLRDLNLGENHISDLTPLSNLTKLTSLRLHKNEISDINAISNLRSLHTLDLWTTGTWTDPQNYISDITPLSELKGLTWLQLGWHQISDISPLANLTKLNHLTLSYNNVTDITALSNLTSLSFLRLMHNQIVDLSPLLENQGLNTGTEVDVTGNLLSTTSVNEYIPQLEGRGVIVHRERPTPALPSSPIPTSIWQWVITTSIATITAIATIYGVFKIKLLKSPLIPVAKRVSAIFGHRPALPRGKIQPKVFLSYVHENSEEVYRLIKELNGKGIKVWQDIDGLVHDL